MKIKKLKKEIISISCILLALLAIVAYYIIDNTFTTVKISGLLPEMSQQEIIEKSHLIVKGTFKEKSKAFEVKSVDNNDTTNFTDYYLVVEEVYRGEVNIGDTIAVRTQGGFVGTVNVQSDIEPKININDTIFVYLYQPNMGGGYETNEDYYYILNGIDGMYKVSDNTLVNKTTNKTFDKTELISYIKETNKNIPINYNWVYEQACDSAKHNLKNGFLTQNEYDKFIENSSKYAKVTKTALLK